MKKIVPFLNEHIPEDLAVKGLNKISPKLGGFLKKGIASGLPIASGLEFIRNGLTKSSSNKIEAAPNARPGELATNAQIERSRNTTDKLKQGARLGVSAAGLIPGMAAASLGAQAIGSTVDQPQGQTDQSQPEQIEPEQQQIPELKAIDEKNAQIEQLYEFARQGKTQGNEFLKYASNLIKSQDIGDYETFSNFYKWWTAKPSAKRGTPRAEFELFRNEIGNTLSQGQSQAALQQDVMNPPGSMPMGAPSAEMQASQNQGQQTGGLSQNLLSGIEASLNLRKKYGNR